jgi:dTDP-4-dehydrorhamnose 3,5-epimerase
VRFHRTEIPGVLDLFSEPNCDARGRVVKTFEERAFREAGLPAVYAEELHTWSRRGVVRGMHFQAPPSAQAKVVFCQYGAILDAVVDLRRGSPDYGVVITRRLSAQAGNGLYVPEGCAHGFCVTGDEAVVSYRLTAPHSPGDEGGVLWNSLGIDWPITDPIVSSRDRGFDALSDFRSPFLYELPEASRA